MTAIELAREIIQQISELQDSVVGGVNLNTINPNDGFIWAIAEQLDDWKRED